MPSAPSSMLQHIGFVDLPKHEASGGFDHAAVHAASGQVYVAHTANSAVDVFDPASRHLYSVPQLPGVAGVLVSNEAQLIITSNRAEKRDWHLCSRPRRASVEGSCRRSPQWPRLRSWSRANSRRQCRGPGHTGLTCAKCRHSRIAESAGRDSGVRSDTLGRV